MQIRKIAAVSIIILFAIFFIYSFTNQGFLDEQLNFHRVKDAKNHNYKNITVRLTELKISEKNTESMNFINFVTNHA